MEKADDVMAMCLHAGQLMLRYGSETFRIEDTMRRMGQAAGMEQVNTFVTTTAIFLSFKSPVDQRDHIQMLRIEERYQDLSKVTSVNQLSREYVSGLLTSREVKKQLKEIEEAPMNYPVWFIYLASGIGGGAFSYLIGSSFMDMLPAALGGLVTAVALVRYQMRLKVKFFSEFLASFTGALVAMLMVQMGLVMNTNQVIIGTIIPLVPGVPLTNAVRDLMSGDLVAGVARGAEAAVSSMSIAGGVAVALTIFFV
ncbi:threonine/serine exporter family protein [Marinococcus sp. PL1-022]|uniref:threonine/serine exporter family protein n=1 Tax=Marinococcus sp. PL1-022 TaxID=3095363 RepID=UPI0029C16FA4|nr:threonine/serine exporter family protein [Marinococcus sp. PL1-022]MDX6154446.1 threonine/serine exporter family protein [Marinococcus sp. PL1-022]